MRALVFIAALGLVAIGVSLGYIVFFMPNVDTYKPVSIKIPTGATFENVSQLLTEKKVLKNERAFEIIARFKNYPDKVKAGNYVLTRNMNNRQLVNMLMAGLQTPVKLVIYNIRTKEEFASLVARSLELDSIQVLNKLNDAEFCKTYQSDTNNILSRVIVANYEFYWNVSFSNFWENLQSTYAQYWNEERLNKANALHLTPDEVTTLASIVEREVMRDKELPTVAGVYINRLRIRMPLQADPTLVFALRDFDAKRVNSIHKDYDSPYNTYLYAGLPPGPICMPKPRSIDAVLDYENHKYLYFCANPDMSGYSIFSIKYADQMRVAAQYRAKLNKMNIH